MTPKDLGNLAGVLAPITCMQLQHCCLYSNYTKLQATLDEAKRLRLRLQVCITNICTSKALNG